MLYTSSLVAFIALASSVRSHGVILKAVGVSGPEGQGFLVDQNLARNCTTISPCQQDATIIRDSEITQNIVNSCGRTEIAGNIDVGEQTELELAAKRVTQVTKGSTIAVTIHQVNADGAGPYECDLDQSSNAAVNFVKLQVANNVPGANGLSQAKEQDFTINVKMPANFNCFGASTGNICTVRCRNNAVAGPFGGCFAVQQTDGTGRTNTSAAAVDTAQTLSGVLAQVEQNKKDLPAAIAANQAAGASGVDGGLLAISALVSSAPIASATAAAGNGKGNGKGNRNGNNGGKGNGKGNGNAGNAAGNANGNAGNAAANAGNAAGNANGNAKGNGKGNGNANANGKGNANANNARARMARGLGKFLV